MSLSWNTATGILSVVYTVRAELTINGAKCGELTCKLDEYCVNSLQQCTSCKGICDIGNHNYDPDVCVKYCQDYIHDLKYVPRSELNQRSNSGGGETQNVEAQARAALIISSVLLTIILIYCFYKCSRYIKDNKNKFKWSYWKNKRGLQNNRVKQYPTDLIHQNPHASEIAKPKTEMKLDIRSGNDGRNEHTNQPLNVNKLDNNYTNSTTDKSGIQTPKTMSTSIIRYPAEDTTLDYSYDNKGLNVTPPPAQEQTSYF